MEEVKIRQAAQAGVFVLQQGVLSRVAAWDGGGRRCVFCPTSEASTITERRVSSSGSEEGLAELGHTVALAAEGRSENASFDMADAVRT